MNGIHDMGGMHGMGAIAYEENEPVFHELWEGRAWARPRFTVAQRVRTRNIHPIGHTRLPRYTRGKQGTIVWEQGVFAFPDTDADGYPLSENPQHVYTVQFAARELWGEQAAARDAVYAGLWEDYLEPA